MKKILFAIIFIVSINPARLPAQIPFQDPNWNTTTLKFNRGFINTLPDTSNLVLNDTVFKWRPSVTGCQSLIYNDSSCSRDKVFYTHQFANMLASDTGLVFIAKAHSNPFLAKRFAYAPQDSAVCIDSNVTNRDTFSYSSSALTSRKRYGYGYYEADIRIAKGQGLFPAFWLYYEGQEIEVMELTGSQSNQTQKYQVNVYGPIIKTSDIVGPFNNTDLSAAYHKYAIEWCNGRVAYFLDGNPVRMVSGKPGDYIPNMELEVIFNLAVDPWETIADPPPDKKMAVRSLKAYSFQYESGSVTTISNYDSFTYKVRDSYVLEDSPVNANNVYLRATDYIQLNAGFSVTSSYNNFNAITTNLSMPQQ